MTPQSFLTSPASATTMLRWHLLAFASFHLCLVMVQGAFWVPSKATTKTTLNPSIAGCTISSPFQAVLPTKPQIPWRTATFLSTTAEDADEDDDVTDNNNNSNSDEQPPAATADTTAPSAPDVSSTSTSSSIPTSISTSTSSSTSKSLQPLPAKPIGSTVKTPLSPFSTSSLTAVASKRNSSRFPSKPSNLKKSQPTTTTKTSRWDSFDYLQHWYPVIWECDLPINKPTKVTLFDVDYVVARDSNGGWTALQDQCPHKAAALSEGRITSSGFLQCAYHGWTFDGATGDCVQIPQSATLNNQGTGGTRACAKAIPMTVHQGMVWLWPGPVQETYPTPPTVPEMDLPGWTSIKVVRDFPCVDWSLLVSNILDPDHGCFAHTQLAFDYYSANAENPLQIKENFDDAGWTLEGQVNAVDKVLKVDQAKRKALGLKTKKEKEPKEDLQATTWFQAPTTVALCRRDANGDTKFITAFWVTPVGTGRSRFMTAAVSNAFPFQLPRWIFTMNLNQFLDQDTVLVASQQPPLLTAEAQGVEKPRASLFSYGSATDKTVRLIDQFWDATLHKAPNRQLSLQQLYHSGQLQHTPPREVVLDRKVQSLDICPDSQGFVRTCRALRNASVGVVAAWMVKAVWQRAWPTKFRWLPLFAAGMAYLTDQLQRQFFFVKTKASRDKDLNKIPIKAWLDL